jgi:hypothetical protein
MIRAAILAALPLAVPALAQQEDQNLYFRAPDGSINVIVPGGPGYVTTPFPNGSGGYNGYTVSPSYPPPYSTPSASPYLDGPRRSYQYEYQRADLRAVSMDARGSKPPGSRRSLPRASFEDAGSGCIGVPLQHRRIMAKWP